MSPSTALPLAGLAVSVEDDRVAMSVAAGLLRRLGASVFTSEDGADVALTSSTTAAPDAPTARLTGTTLSEVDGLPSGTLVYASGLALAGAGLLAHLSANDVTVDHTAVAAQVLLPLVMAASYGVPAPQPAAPYAVPGGYVSRDLGDDGDRDAFDRVLDLLGPNTDPQRIATEAQGWRLPVCSYRTRGPATPRPDLVANDPGPARLSPDDRPRRRTTRPDTGQGAQPLAGVVVCDLTAMWAGPLATWLLAEAGAEVIKVESSVRPDGLRAFDGGGIHPPGSDPRSGNCSAMFNALNRRKKLADLDLRGAEGKAEIAELVRRSELVIDNFSRRVMPNFGLSPLSLRRFNPDVATLSMPAFPRDHPTHQVALGPGIHAMTGLGDVGRGEFAAPVVAYPDPLAGIASFATALALLIGVRRQRRPAHREVTLLDCTASLARRSVPTRHVALRDHGLGARLLTDRRLAGLGAWESVSDGAGVHAYPRSPFVSGVHPTTPQYTARVAAQ